MGLFFKTRSLTYWFTRKKVVSCRLSVIRKKDWKLLSENWKLFLFYKFCCIFV